ncbi:MAG: hypothetical protein R3D32_02040 [Nitratireductor sp.]
MAIFRGAVAPVLAATIWISVSEFFRNEFWLKEFWAGHYAKLGLEFPSAPVNGMIWGLWALLFAIAIRTILMRFDLVSGALLAWLVGFVLMWVVTFNLGVLPLEIIPYAIPLSLLEAFVAAWLITRLTPGKTG